MIAIHTKFLAPTNSRGSRIKAYTSGAFGLKGFEATVPYDHAYDSLGAHFEAVKALIEKHQLDWSTDGMRYGDSADGRGFCFCFDESKVEGE